MISRETQLKRGRAPMRKKAAASRKAVVEGAIDLALQKDKLPPGMKMASKPAK